jgi:hypothetical protein
MSRRITAGPAVVFIGLGALAWFVWFDPEDCRRTVDYQVGAGVETPQQALQDFGLEPTSLRLSGSKDLTRAYVDGTREITLSFVEPGWAVTTDVADSSC